MMNFDEHWYNIIFNLISGAPSLSPVVSAPVAPTTYVPTTALEVIPVVQNAVMVPAPSNPVVLNGPLPGHPHPGSYHIVQTVTSPPIRPVTTTQQHMHMPVPVPESPVVVQPVTGFENLRLPGK